MNWAATICPRLTAWWASIPSVWPSLEDERRPEVPRFDREQLIAEWLALDAHDQQDAAASQRRLSALGAELQCAEHHAATLRDEIDREHGRRMAQSFEYDSRRDKLRAELGGTCPPQVDRFLEQVNAEIAHYQRTPRVGPSATRRVRALQRAREHADALRGAPLTSADILTALHRIERSLPDVPADQPAHGLAAVHSRPTED